MPEPDQIARRTRSAMPALMQAALVLLAIATVIFSLWLSSHVTARAVVRRGGGFTMPYATHGGTVFVTPVEWAQLIFIWVLTAALVVGQLWLNRLRRRRDH